MKRLSQVLIASLLFAGVCGCSGEQKAEQSKEEMRQKQVERAELMSKEVVQ